MKQEETERSETLKFKLQTTVSRTQESSKLSKNWKHSAIVGMKSMLIKPNQYP
jgi:hypothetical protein